MRKKILANIITRWLEGWVSQTHGVENIDITILDFLLASENQIKHLRWS